jgi:phenylpropionate dioxygenase-like ring-hydroxylating dioxygenase large terminal subunit
VFFRDNNGDEVALNNACPHRAAPLHLGKLEGGTIQCAYHGLRFGSDGMCQFNPHGKGQIPSSMRTHRFPLVETHNMLWIWMGDPELADPAAIPDFSCHTNDNYPFVKDTIEMHAYYELIADNLMDLSHVQFLHEGILGSEAIGRGEHQVEQSGTTIWSNRWCPDGLAPPACDKLFKDYGKAVGHWLYMRWDAPSHMLLDVGITPTGRPREEGIWWYGTDILTPRDANSTYYFWGVARSHDRDDPKVDEIATQAIEMAFGHQDKPMIEAQAEMIRNLGGEDINDIDYVPLPFDAGPARIRKLLRELLEAQAIDNSGLPDPRNPDPEKLISENRYTHRIEPVV